LSGAWSLEHLHCKPPANTHSADDSQSRVETSSTGSAWLENLRLLLLWALPVLPEPRLQNPDSDKKPGFARLSSRSPAASQPRCPAARFVGGTHSGTKQEHAKRRGIDEFGVRYDWSGPASGDSPLATRQRRPTQRRVSMTYHNIMSGEPDRALHDT